MTRTISLIIGITVTALAVGVAPAFGEGRLAGSIETDGVAYFKANEMTTLVQQNGVPVVSRPDSHDIVQADASDYLDAASRSQRINVVVPTAATDSFERAAPPAGSPRAEFVSAGGGTDLDWSQIGLGFGIGLLLAVGLYAAMRLTKDRPLAH